MTKSALEESVNLTFFKATKPKTKRRTYEQ